MVAMATSLSCRVSAISAFCRLTTQTPPLTNRLSHKASCSNFSPKIRCHGNVHWTLDRGYIFIGYFGPENAPREANSVSLAIIQPKLQLIGSQKVVGGLSDQPTRHWYSTLWNLRPSSILTMSSLDSLIPKIESNSESLAVIQPKSYRF